MATFNGRQYLPAQIDSILSQTGVSIQLFVADDGSTDGTQSYLSERAAVDHRITFLESLEKCGSAAAKFYQLICEAPWQDFAYIAFADQDDVWLPWKLFRHAQLLEATGVAGVSSDVIAVWPNDRQKLIKKSYPQTKYDFLFESPGPGCSMLVRRDLLSLVRNTLIDYGPSQRVAYHDWLIYAVARAAGMKWLIDVAPSVHYRQHSQNEMGANFGFGALIKRLKMLTGGYLRTQGRQILAVTNWIRTRQGHAPIEKISPWEVLRHGRRRCIHRVLALVATLPGLTVQ